MHVVGWLCSANQRSMHAWFGVELLSYALKLLTQSRQRKSLDGEFKLTTHAPNASLWFCCCDTFIEISRF